MRGRLFVDTAYTQGIAGWVEGESASLGNLDFETDNSFAVLIASSLSNQPIATTKRLLVSAIARVEPTGFRWVDSWKREVADPGRPPFLQEPVSAKIVWRRKGVVRAFVLDNNVHEPARPNSNNFPAAMACRSTSTARRPHSIGN